MISLDEVAPSFQRAKDRWSGAPTLVAQYRTVREAYEGSGQALIESVKSFIECACRTIIGDFGGTAADSASTTELLVQAMEQLGIRNTRGANKFNRVLSAHNKLADALSDCRNQDGSVAHGKDGYLDALAEHHVRMYLLTGDTILSLLLCALDRTEPDLEHTREPYDRFVHFNRRIDESTGIAAQVDEDDGTLVVTLATPGLREGLMIRLEPSRLLYQCDRSAYVEILDSLPRAFGTDVALPPDAVINAPGFPLGADTAPGLPSAVDTYSGPLQRLAPALWEQLRQLGFPPDGPTEALAPSLLHGFVETAGLDWAERPALRARIAVTFKRLVRGCSAGSVKPDEVAERLLDWFARQTAWEPVAGAWVPRRSPQAPEGWPE